MEQTITISIDSVQLTGILAIPEQIKGLVIFAHGSGSSRLSPRNNFVARVLQEANFGTLLFDLLTEEEDTIYENRFDISLLAKRLVTVTNWIRKQPRLKNLPIGYFGASTGSAAALIAAAQFGEIVKAVVSRGGRPDLASNILPQVRSPVLLIIGGNDFEVIKLNERARDLLTSKKELTIVPGATHLFEESGTLEEVARLAVKWFEKYLAI